MSFSSNNSLSTDIASDTSGNIFSSKLRRLKIQENVLAANVNKCFVRNSDETDGHNKYQNDIQLKKYFTKLKDKFREVKHLFEEITLKTNDPESFENTDIDELKRDILELETKIRIARQFISNELKTLQNEEITLMELQATSEPSSKEGNNLLKCINKPQLKEYKEIVPSPVRVLIHSPFKCQEVQEFQEFMKNSPTRYGGWNEYSHNIFIQIWNKYYGENNVLTAVKCNEVTFSSENFREEVLQKIPGSDLESIDSHSKWYSKYLYLKSKQQKALDKWRENKRKIKPTQKTRLIQIDDPSKGDVKSQIDTKLCRRHIQANVMDQNINRGWKQDAFGEPVEHNEDTKTSSERVRQLTKNVDILRLSRPTEQTLRRQRSDKESYEFNKTLESIGKLRVPSWRLSLRE